VISHLREFTDLPLGVAPNLGYLTVDGWETEGSLVRMARGWRDEGAELIGGCCGVGPEHIAALSAALAGA
jgi:methionine synthase I (cobalamin-dependent)